MGTTSTPQYSAQFLLVSYFAEIRAWANNYSCKTMQVDTFIILDTYVSDFALLTKFTNLCRGVGGGGGGLRGGGGGGGGGGLQPPNIQNINIRTQYIT